MSLPQLITGPLPARDDVQQTAFSYDIMGRYVCNNWPELVAAQNNGGYPFDAVVIGAGMFGGYAAERLYRLGASLGLRVLVLEAGAFLLPSHIQNLPQRLGGSVGGPVYLRTRDDASGTQNVVWGMPWLSNERFPGLAYCIGGRSLFWGGWSPRLTPADLGKWPAQAAALLNAEYPKTEVEIGVSPTAEYISGPLFTALQAAFTAAQPSVPPLTAIETAPLAVLGSPPAPGLFPFDKFSSGPFLIDAIRNDAANNTAYGDVSRRIFLLPRVQVLRLNTQGNTVTSIDLAADGQRQTLSLSPGCAVVLAMGTIEATRLALESLGIGSTQFGSPRVGNLMVHLRSNTTVRIKRSALGLAAPPSSLETAALLVRGSALGRQFHLQVTAAAVTGPNPEQNLFSMVPDFDVLQNIVANQDPDWIVLTFRGIGEVQDQRSLNPDPARSWVDLSNETDAWQMRRAFVNLALTTQDLALWDQMDAAAIALAQQLAGNPANIQYFYNPTGPLNTPGARWNNAPPPPSTSSDPADPANKVRDLPGTTHHEAGTLFMGAPGTSLTNLSGCFHSVTNTYVAGPAVFPTLGSANPSLTAITLVRNTAQAIIQAATPPATPGFTPLSLSPQDWQMVQQPGSLAGVRHYGQVLETVGSPTQLSYGLYWYIKEAFSNFALLVDWRVARLDDNSGIYIRVPPPTVPNPLSAADTQGLEVQIDERGYDSATNTIGHPLQRTGAIYNLSAPTAFPSNSIGLWNTFRIEANGQQIKVTLNGQLVNTYQSNRLAAGHLVLQAHHGTSRVQFRNLQIQKFP
jgi:hypothetical protein